MQEQNQEQTTNSYRIRVLGLKPTANCPITVRYPPNIQTIIEIGQSVQNVMEKAADRNSRYIYSNICT